jgi:hypothetical protein
MKTKILKNKSLRTRDIVVYVSGKYSAKTRKGVEKNVELARQYATKIWDLGFTVICPHTNTDNFEKLCKNTKYNDFMDGDLELLERSDILFMMPNWKDSEGAKKELEYAKHARNKIILYDIGILELLKGGLDGKKN